MRWTAVAASGFAITAVVAAAAGFGLADDKKASYVGDKKCVQCHYKQHSTWKKTVLAKSLDTLRPVKEADDKALFDARKKANSDPAKDYTTDPKCLACHTTGYGRDGGYPEKITDDNRKIAEAMGSVSCEACHGPGSIYLEYKKQKKDAVKKENEAKKEGEPKPEATFTREELAKVGLVLPTEETCKACHNKDAPSQPATPFKFEDAKAKVHDHVK